MFKTWKAKICLISLAAILFSGLWLIPMVFFGPRFTVEENYMTGQIHVKLNKIADRYLWNTDVVMFGSVKEACEWIKFQERLGLEKNAWVKVDCKEPYAKSFEEE